MMKLVLTAAVSLLLGLGLGWVAFHGEPVVQNLETKVVVPVPVPARTLVLEGAARQEPCPGVAPSAAPRGGSPVSAPPPEEEVVKLRATVSDLEGRLALEQKLRQGVEGQKVPLPPGTPARLRDEQQLVTAFNAALAEAGFPGQVSSVDCSEHPCIVFGNGFGARGDLEKLLPTSGFSPYAKDSMSTFGFQRGKDEADPASRFFGVAVLPPGAEPSDELSKRIAFRVRQMEEASRPQKK